MAGVAFVVWPDRAEVALRQPCRPLQQHERITSTTHPNGTRIPVQPCLPRRSVLTTKRSPRCLSPLPRHQFVLLFLPPTGLHPPPLFPKPHTLCLFSSDRPCRQGGGSKAKNGSLGARANKMGEGILIIRWKSPLGAPLGLLEFPAAPLHS